MHEGNKHVRIMPASRLLQAFVGTGKFREENIKKAQAIIDRVQGNLDISDMAQQHMQEMSEVINDIKAGKDEKEIIEKATHSLVDFKSNAGMFDEGKYINLPILLFQWMESIETIDQDSTDIIEWYFLIMNKILIEKQIKDDQVDPITKEMAEACKRYYAKHPEIEQARIIDNVDTLFGDEGQTT